MISSQKNITKLYEAGALAAIDIEFCRFLQQLHPEIKEPVLLAACLTSKAYRNGDVCIMLDDYDEATAFTEFERALQPETPGPVEWINVLGKSPVVGSPGDFKPLILDEANRLYFHKLWQYEQNLAAQILKRAQLETDQIKVALLRDGLKRLFNNKEKGKPDWQQIAAASAVYNKFTVISGGPGTGKTTTIICLLALMLEQARALDQSPKIALAAPTGKAAARMEASILKARKKLNVSDDIKAAIPAEAVTIHQLLGARLHTSVFRYNSDNPLPFDVVIIDEASMIDQALMSKLMDALREKTKLVLLGDKDQLASVEAGSVMGDICGDAGTNIITPKRAEKMEALSATIPALNIQQEGAAPLINNIILLTQNYRFKGSSGIGALALAINTGDSTKAVSILKDASLPDVELNQLNSYADFQLLVAKQIKPYFTSALKAKTPEEAFTIYNRFRILAAHRKGPWGVEYINDGIEDSLLKAGLVPRYEPWYAGKPIIINRNDYSLGLSNGDLGICLPDTDDTMKVFFNKDGSMVGILPSRLAEYSTAFALTVHKSQGSEFENILLVLPDKRSKVLSRELLYTAVTRAKHSVKIIGDASVFSEAVGYSLARNSGLKDYLWNLH